MRSIMQGISQGTNVKHLNLELLKLIKFAIPPIAEQQKIAEILGSVDEYIEKLKEKKAKLGRVKKGLMNDLLSGRWRVIN